MYLSGYALIYFTTKRGKNDSDENPTKLTQIYVIWAALGVKRSEKLKKAKKILKARAKAEHGKLSNYQIFFCFLGSIEGKNSMPAYF